MKDKDPYENFCVHPFVKMFVSTQGQMRACCYAQQPLSKDISIIDNGIQNIWNGETFQQIRKSFNERKIPRDVCRICIENESQGIPSQRQYENARSKELTDFYYHNPTTVVPSPPIFSLRMSNECNLQCVMCRPQLSNQIAKNMSLYNKKDKDNSYTHEWNVEQYLTSESNYSDDFSDFIIDNIDHTKEICAVGGEPFVMKGFQSLIEKIVDLGKSSHVALTVTTNGTVIKEPWIEKYLTKFKKVFLGISLDATGDILEYVRYPSNWPVLEKKIINLKSISNKHSNITVNLEPTIQMLNLKGLPLFIEFVKKNSIKINPTFLDTPTPLHFANTTLQYRNEIVSQIQDDVNSLIDDNLLDDAGWLNWVNSEPQRKLSDRDRTYFKHMIQYFDATRTTKFFAVYPELEYLL